MKSGSTESVPDCQADVATTLLQLEVVQARAWYSIFQVELSGCWVLGTVFQLTGCAPPLPAPGVFICGRSTA